MSYCPAMFTVQFKNHSENRSKQDDGPVFQGRNGLGLQTGLLVGTGGLGHLRLTPVSTKGAANGYLSVPVEEIDTLVAALQKVKAALTA